MRVAICRKYLRASTKGARLCYVLIFWYVFSAILVGFLGCPKAIVYVGDLINVYVFAVAVKRCRYRVGLGDKVLNSILIFALVALFSGIISMRSPLLFLWGIRQNFRYFLFYYSCSVLLREEDYCVLFNFIKILFWVSLPLSAYEALMVSYPVGIIVGDYVGGIFYGIQGVNAPLNIVMIIYCTKILIDYFDKKIHLSRLVIVMSAAMAMATFSELKVFLVEIVIIAVIVMLYKGTPIKSFILIALALLGVGIVVQAFVNINGQGRSYYTTDYLSISGMLENAFRTSGYDGNGDLNRFYAIQTLTEKFFKNDLMGFLFGLGLGNAEYSIGYSFLTSSFYSSYSWLHYQYFSISFVFIETGIVGIVSYFMIFITGAVQGFKYLGKRSNSRIFYVVMIVMMLIMIFYNPALRNEQCGFMLYMILALPAVCKRERRTAFQETQAFASVVHDRNKMPINVG